MATHLKSLAKKAKLDEGHAKDARVYKARVASLTSERTELRDRVQRMTEGREDEARNSLRAAKGELREVRDELRAAQNDLLEARDGLQSAQYEFQMVRDELLTSQGELRESTEELRAVKDELQDKTALLNGAHREVFEAVNSAERLTEECRGLREDLHQQVTLVAHKYEVIGRLRDETCTQWVSRWLAFQRRAANAYPDLYFNFDIPSDEEVEKSLSADYSGEPVTSAEVHTPSSPSAPPSDA